MITVAVSIFAGMWTACALYIAIADFFTADYQPTGIYEAMQSPFVLEPEPPKTMKAAA